MAVSETIEKEVIRKFETGATRDSEEGKLDYEGFLHPLVVERYAEHMQKHRKQSDGDLRDSDNWQKGIPKDVYMKSAWRHFHTMWKAHRGYTTTEPMEEAICALIFNASGYLLELLKDTQDAAEISEWQLQQMRGMQNATHVIGDDSPLRRHARPFPQEATQIENDTPTHKLLQFLTRKTK